MIDPDESAEPWRPEVGEEPQSVGALARRLSSSRDWGARLGGARIHSAWAAIAGEAVAQHVQPVRLLRGVLVVQADSSAWAAQLRYLQAELIAQANAVLGADQVRQIRITTRP